MASRSLVFSLHISTLTLFILSKTATCCFTHIFGFGDSMSDNGNLLKSIGDRFHPVGYLPYGETYFGRPTGRFSDGRIILDFVAEGYELPFIPPYLSGTSPEDFPHGANFAFAGATALSDSYFESRGIVPYGFYTLDTQIHWFKNLLASISEQPGYSSDYMSNVLFVVGEIGGNDYNHPMFDGRTLDEVRTFVPDVLSKISLTIQELISCGAKTLLVPNIFPIGCNPIYLTTFQSKNREDYDSKTGCIKPLNEFIEYHNAKLSKELEKLRQLYPNVTIIYGDYYAAAMKIFSNPEEFGFSYPLVACCGSEGPYNYSSLAKCGYPRSTVCSDPSKYVSWDGLHVTEAAYKLIAQGLLDGTHSSPPIPTNCSNFMHDSA
ncbi:hypothetical protein LUZ63_013070 [Rhynchospora breviuscula]|uniref:Uncharacterized protein n=1 Tax=Rhynchospora breviuscula TaxID=2022672 RepID=A0A9Q0C7W5_9POAL|nr:hypothetical protein LUZ63_013070 [Rhynchospora breviuscula]